MQTLKISVAFLGAGAKSTALLVLHSNIFKQPLQSSKKSASSAPTLSPYRLTVSYAIACIQCVPCTPRSNPVLGHHQVCKCFHCLQSSHPQSSKSTEAKKTTGRLVSNEFSNSAPRHLPANPAQLHKGECPPGEYGPEFVGHWPRTLRQRHRSTCGKLRRGASWSRMSNQRIDLPTIPTNLNEDSWIIPGFSSGWSNPSWSSYSCHHNHAIMIICIICSWIVC